MSEPKNIATDLEEGSALFCAIASNGNMVGQRGGTFSTRQAIFVERQKEEVLNNCDRSSEDE